MLYQAVLGSIASPVIKILQTNDDGWAEINIRTLHNILTVAGQNAVVSAPAINLSGTGSCDIEPFLPVIGGCEFSSCPPGSPAVGHNTTRPRLNYVNSCPATAMRKGIDEISRPFFSGTLPDLALTGPNVGLNTGFTVLTSGTVGAAVEAVFRGIPALAFSGASGEQTAWNAIPAPLYSRVYAELAWNLTQQIVQAGPPFLPPGVFLNVNFPAVSEDSCADPANFKYVLSRIDDELFKGDDIVTCGNQGRLPSEASVIAASNGGRDCLVSISVGDASSKTDSDSTAQAVVLDRLGHFLSCLPHPPQRDNGGQEAD